MTTTDSPTINGVPQPQPAPRPTVEQAQRSAVSEGQRRVNLIWECTQAVIALGVVCANIVVAVHTGLSANGKVDVPPMLTDSLFVIIGFYFGRTNHASIGGVGTKPSPEGTYEGR